MNKINTHILWIMHYDKEFKKINMTSQSHSVHCVTQFLTISFLNIAEHPSYKLVIYMFHCDDVTMGYCWNDVRNSLHLKWLLIFMEEKMVLERVIKRIALGL